ncbi:MAG: hypothetical protein ACRD92_01650 [Nitrosopumilaceae archaeon]
MKKIISIVIIAVVVIISISVLSSEKKPEKTAVYHIMLADPKIYNNGIFTDTFQIQNGSYQFRFVSHGQSPQTLSITLNSPKFSFSEDFKLEGIPRDTGISTYYTWDYLGVKEIIVTENQQLEIVINPHGNILDTVSVYLIKTSRHI